MGAPLLIAWLCLAQAGAVQSSADRLSYEPSTGAALLLGHARLVQGELSLRADEIDYDPARHFARAEGDVVFADGLLGGAALKLELDLQARAGRFSGATLYQKAGVTPAELADARTPEAMFLLGRNELTLRAELVQQLEADLYQADDVFLTPCDCKAPGWLTEPPSWSIRAAHARVRPGQSARLSWATLYIKDVPVLPVPLLLLPLSNRQTGFLLPRPNYTANNGFQLELPFFWAISRSVDATFTPGYFFGETHGDPAGARDPAVNGGMRGPRLQSELRYVPSVGTRGQLDVTLVEDTKPASPAGIRGLRGELAATHVEELGAGFEARLDAAMVSDQRYFQDVTADIVAAQASYLRSDARIDHRSDATDAYLTASYYQALSGVSVPSRSLGPFFGPNDVNAATFQRLPALGFTLEERGLGPLRYSVELDGARYSPLAAREGRACPAGDVACAPSLQLLDARELEDRIGVQPELRLPILLGRFAELAPYALFRGDAWHLESADPDRARGLAIVGAELKSELSRTFAGSGPTRWRHVVAPSLELRQMPWQAGSSPDLAADERDLPVGGPRSGAALPALFQGVARFTTYLQRREGDAISEPLRLEVGQGYDFARGELADTFADLELEFGRFSASAMARYAIPTRTLAGFRARAAFGFAGGSSISASFDRLSPALTDPMRAALYDLVGSPAVATDAGAPLAERLDLAGHWQASPALGFDLGLGFLPSAELLDAFTRDPGAVSQPTASWRRLFSYSAGITYGSPCQCWSLRAAALFQPTATQGVPWRPVSFFVLLDAHRLGGSLPLSP